jgi:hypothetical protein
MIVRSDCCVCSLVLPVKERIAQFHILGYVKHMSIQTKGVHEQ